MSETISSGSSSSSVPSSSGSNIIYGSIPVLPTQNIDGGFRFDFNSGIRVSFPEDGKYHLRFWNADTNVLIYDSDVNPNSIITGNRKYLVRWRFEISRAEDRSVVVDYTMDLKGRNVVVQMPVNTLGDSIGWFSYLERFQKKFGCVLHVVSSVAIRGLFERQYPNFKFIGKDEVQSVEDLYACYYLGLFFSGSREYQPVDFRISGLHRQAGMILGLRTKEELEDIPPRVSVGKKRPMKEKLVAVCASAIGL